jgi:6-pyruvoyltetrahydropterin/6-carboxytetrahydropterin synthase
MLADYGDLKALVQPLVDGALDHYHLNDSLGTPNPTSERVARWVYCALLDRLPAQVDRPWRLSAVEVEETCTSACRYEEPDGH